MKGIVLGAFCSALIALTSCKKDNADSPTNDAVTETQVLTDFANTVANPNYQDIQAKANLLAISVQALNSATIDSNLTAARNAWYNLRIAWKRCESYLFGPVEDFHYNLIVDTWPINRVDMDSLLASANTLSLSDIHVLPASLKGFHPIEYLLFGIGGSKTATDITAREKMYLVSLAESLYNTTTDLRNSWDVNQPGNFTNQFITAGNGSSRFATRKDAFLAMVSAMAGICDEVANGKMEEPLAAQDSTLEESQFAHSSTSDFKNNIIGIRNVYLSRYFGDGHGLDEIVAAKNLSLDNALKSQITVAINSFNAINSNYGAAIYTQQVQIHNAQDAINTLRATIEADLTNFVHTYIKD